MLSALVDEGITASPFDRHQAMTTSAAEQGVSLAILSIMLSRNTLPSAKDISPVTCIL